MAKKKTKAAPRRTDEERLRGILGSVVKGDRTYSRKEMAKKLRVSVSTLYRIMSNPDYKLSEKTSKRIHKRLVIADRKHRTWVQRGVKKMPKLRVLTVPFQRLHKTGGRTLTFGTELLSTKEKEDILLAFKKEGRSYAYTLVVGLPKGMVYARATTAREGVLYLDNNARGPNESHYFTAGPFEFHVEDAAQILSRVRYHDDAGRKVSEITITQESDAEHKDRMKKYREIDRASRAPRAKSKAKPAKSKAAPRKSKKL